MLPYESLFKRAMAEIISIFGKEYLKENYEGTCQAEGIIDTGEYQFFVGIKDLNDLPGRKADEKGWVVYANVLIDAITGNVVKREYVLE